MSENKLTAAVFSRMLQESLKRLDRASRTGKATKGLRDDATCKDKSKALRDRESASKLRE